MAKQRRALVIGGSMSGLLAGIMLHRRGWDVDIFERVGSELSGRGAGIVAQAELIARLDALGLDTSDLGVAMTTRQILDRDGRTTATIDCPQVLTAWERVYRVLRDAFPPQRYHRGLGLIGFDARRAKRARAVERRPHGGSRRSGRRRRLAFDGAAAMPARRRAALCRLCGVARAVAERAIPPAIHRELFELMTFCLPPGEQCLGYPVAGPDNELRLGQRRYNVVWYRPADEATELPWLLTDDKGVTHSISIPPPLIRRDPIAAMRAAAERLLAPQFREIVRLIDEPILQPIYDLESPRLAFGRVAILGDAAFVARPHVAAGVSKAADDAAALAQALDGDDVEAALRAFEAERLPQGRKIIERARHLGAYLQATQTAEERARSERHSIPEAVLAETAVLDFLHA